ncbi:phosphomannomutase [Oceaniglobus trochenteri]|uniref:phosphomannomutase n=1 Tax=Oceaniglobus trochenteri TaxID=2763260 RepID=UPI001CFFBDE2|nr:phosphomannomutase [Oceaniglobus trochenteri]
MAPKFGTSGLRGLVSELTDTLCANYTRAFLNRARHDGVLLVGADLRPSSRAHLRAVAAGARAAGLEVVDCGTLPTPALALEAQHRRAPAVMVTGSHIPADRNGLKFYRRNGEITKGDEAAINAALRDWNGPLDLTDPPTDAGVAARYAERYTGFFAADALGGLRVGLYEHSAVGRDLLGQVLKALGAKVVPLGRSDHFIPVDTEAVDDDTRARLHGWAGEHQLDAIVSMDGDSDRPLITDATGRVVPGDVIGALTAQFLGARIIVTPVSSNTMIDSMGFDAILRTRIGSPFVIAEIETALGDSAKARVVGYEANGGFLTGFPVEGPGGTLAPLLTRDAFLPILCTLAGIVRNGALADQVAALPARRTAADRLVGLPSETSARLIASLRQNRALRAELFAALGEETHLNQTDGLRITFASGEVVHLRPSGNAPELRCYGEATTEDRARAIVRTTLDEVNRRYA